MKKEEKHKKHQKGFYLGMFMVIVGILIIITIVYIEYKYRNTDTEETNILEDVECDDDKCPVQEIGTDVNIIVEGETDIYQNYTKPTASAPVIINVT